MEAKELFGARLKQARKMKGLSMDQLAAKMNGKIGRQSIYKYEKGLMLPSSANLLQLSETLELSPDYFFTEPDFPITNIHFRKKRLSAKETEQIREMSADSIERLFFMESILGIAEAPPELPRIRIESKEDSEKAAREIRRLWNIGNNPISSSAAFIEKQGIRIIYLPEIKHFDGLCGYVNDSIPIIVLSDNSIPEGIRFTLMHEVGHLVLDSNDFTEEMMESSCRSFASEMLLPSEVLEDLIGKKRKEISFKELESIQIQYGISIPAIMNKANHLGIITSGSYAKFRNRYRSDITFRFECDKSRFFEPRSSKLEAMVYHAASEGIISESKAASLLDSTAEEIRKHLGTF